MTGKVVLITGASSGIGEHLACQYAIPADVSKLEDCKRWNTLGDDINFWGSTYSTCAAIPHLRKTNGKIVVIASSGGWLMAPRMGIYCASKAALISIYETLRIEFGNDIGITIVTPGLIESEMTQGKFLSKEGVMELDQEIRDVEMSFVPIESSERCANAIVNSACRGDRHLTEPSWVKITLYWKVFCPEILEWSCRLLLITEPGTPEREALSKKILDLTGAKKFLYPPSIKSPELKVV